MVEVRIRRRRGNADEALVRQMFDLHGNAMLAYATRLTGDRGTAEDVFQEVLVCAWRNPDGLGSDKNRDRIRLLSMIGNVVAVRQRQRTSPASRQDGFLGRPRAGRALLGGCSGVDHCVTFLRGGSGGDGSGSTGDRAVRRADVRGIRAA
jgi:hypothetical protein